MVLDPSIHGLVSWWEVRIGRIDIGVGRVNCMCIRSVRYVKYEGRREGKRGCAKNRDGNGLSRGGHRWVQDLLAIDLKFGFPIRVYIVYAPKPAPVSVG